MFFYSIGIWLYGLGIRIASLFLPKAKLWIRGRRGIFAKMEAEAVRGARYVWVHCASLGEFEQGRPVIEAIRREHPEYKIVLTFFSPSGYEVRKDYPGVDHIYYLPLDTPSNARRFVSIFMPEKAIIVKYEYWLNYLKELRRSGCHAYVISAIFRRKSVFFRWYGGIFRKALRGLERVFVQDGGSVELLGGIGVERVTVAGDTRFDRVAAIAAGAAKLPIVEKFAAGKQVFVAGSTWPPDEDILLDVMAWFPDMKFIIAPHEIGQGKVESLMTDAPLGAVCYTQADEADNLADGGLLVIDTIGILSSVYQYGNYAYIGGGFGVGIHNILEAATFGLPVAFGPNYGKFKEARDLVAQAGARSVRDADELAAWLSELRKDKSLYDKTREICADYVAVNTGATKIILEEVFPDNAVKNRKL